LTGANVATSFCFIPALQESLCPGEQVHQFVLIGKRFHGYINKFIFPLYLVSTAAAITFAPSTLRRNIILGGLLGTMGQYPVTKYIIAPIAVEMKKLDDTQKEDGGDELLSRWNQLSIYRLGFSFVGIGALVAAIIV